MQKYLTIATALVALALASCGTVGQIYTAATTATVSGDVVRPAANAFDILKGTAANFAGYCIANNFTPTGCDVDTRRKISEFVKSGTKARVTVRAALASGSSVAATVYNTLVDAVNGLKATPVNTFTGG